MKLVGLLSWFDEPTKDLERCIRSFHACGMTHLVCCDGAYGLFPGGAPVSDSRQHATITSVCNELAVDLRIYLPPRMWETETDKRATVFRIAEREFATTLDDWLIVIDADEYVPAPRDLRPMLATLTLDAADLHVDEPGGGGNPAKQFEIRKLFRAIPGLTVRLNHHTYVAADKVLWGFGQVESADLSQVTVRHMTNLRPARRRVVKERYYYEREAQGIETQHGCYMAGCDAEATVKLRSGFTYDVDRDKLRSNAHRACDKHKRRLVHENRSVLPGILRVLSEHAVIYDPALIAGKLAALLSEHGDDEFAGAFGETDDTLPALLTGMLQRVHEEVAA